MVVCSIAKRGGNAKGMAALYIWLSAYNVLSYDTHHHVFTVLDDKKGLGISDSDYGLHIQHVIYRMGVGDIVHKRVDRYVLS